VGAVLAGLSATEQEAEIRQAALFLRQALASRGSREHSVAGERGQLHLTGFYGSALRAHFI
jgi:hypothetical protein